MVQIVFFLYLTPLFAADVPPLFEAIANKATGVLHFAGLDDTYRESVLYWDGTNYKISIAGMPSLMLVPQKGSTDTRPYGPRRLPINFYTWSQTSRGWSVDIMIDSDEILEEKHSEEKLAPDVVLPRARVTLKQHLTFPIASGRFFATGQDKTLAVVDEDGARVHVITFGEKAHQCAKELLEQNRIQVRK